MSEHTHDPNPPNPFKEALKAMRSSPVLYRLYTVTPETSVPGTGPWGGIGHYSSRFSDTSTSGASGDDYLLALSRLRLRSRAGADMQGQREGSRRKNGTSVSCAFCV